MGDEIAFMKSLAGNLVPVMQREGFSGSSIEYKRLAGRIISILSVQEHSDRSKCCVNLGVHLDFLPAVPGNTTVAIGEMSQSQCEIKKRLVPGHGLSDYWWEYRAGDRAVGNIIASFQEDGRSFFGRFAAFPLFWTSIDVERLKEDFSGLLPGVTRVRAALMLARIHKFNGSNARCREFAEFGLSVAKPMASGPKRELKRLLDP